MVESTILHVWRCAIYEYPVPLSSHGGQCLTHHCVIYSKVNWLPFGACCLCHWYNFIYTILCKLLIYLPSLLNFKFVNHNLLTFYN